MAVHLIVSNKLEMGDAEGPCPRNRGENMQLFAHKAHKEQTYLNDGSWEFPQGAVAQTLNGEDALLVPAELSKQARRIFGRRVRSRQAPDHLNPGAGGGGIPRLYRFVVKLSFDSSLYPDFETSILARATAWFSGARRRERPSPKLLSYLGNPFDLSTAKSSRANQLSALSWRPPDELAWRLTAAHSFRLSKDYGLTVKTWRRQLPQD